MKKNNQKNKAVPIAGGILACALLIAAGIFGVKAIDVDPVNSCSYNGFTQGASTLVGFNNEDVKREYVPIWSLASHEKKLRDSGKCYEVRFWWTAKQM